MELIEALNWRYATKKMNGETVPAEKLGTILEAIRLSASSSGLQPYKVIVVSNRALLAKIHEQACPQPQVLEGSHLLVFASKTKMDASHVDDYMARIVATRGTPMEMLAPFADSIKGGLLSRSEDVNAQWMARQAYIALGVATVAAANERVDATPMEGFNNAAMDEILGLKEQGLQSVVLLALGYRDAEKDFLAGAKKVRLSREEMFEERG